MDNQKQSKEPSLNFERIEKIEHNKSLLMSLIFKKEILVAASEVFHDVRVKLAVTRLLGYWDEVGGALPSHNFAHAMGTSHFAVCWAVEYGTDSSFLPLIAIASLFQDSGRVYGRSDRVVHSLFGASSYGIKDSVALSMKIMSDRLSGPLSEDEIQVISTAMSEPRGQFGRFVYTGDTFELSDPFRNSAIAYENRVSRGQGAKWIIGKYYDAMVKKMDGLLPKDKEKVTQSCWQIGDWAYNFSLREIDIDRAISHRIGYCAARGIQTLLLESNGAIHTKVTSISPMLKLHSNKIRRKCMESMVKKSSVEMGRLRELLREDASYCESLRKLESHGRLNRKIH